VAGIKSILLHVDATPASIARLAITRQLAARLEARITALFGATADADRVSFAYSAGALLAHESESGDPARNEAKSRLQRSVDSDGPPVVWCDVVADSIRHGFLEEAAYADLLVVGQLDDAQEGGAPTGFVEAMILGSGKPTLVIPRALRTAGIGQRVLVAWDGSTQAARALTGSLPFLERAEQVHVVSWSRHPRSAPFSHVDVGGYLREHDISAESHHRHATPHVAAELAALAASLQADLVVMGCYGHSRASERLFGGVSRAALAGGTVALLMAH
jgi:nucleotide-binding universal stress UspA family protein